MVDPKELRLNQKHLHLEMARIDILLRREVQRWKLANQEPNSFRGLLVSQAEAEALLARPFATSWGQTVSLPAEQGRAYEQSQAAGRQEREQFLQEVGQENITLNLIHLADAFGLDEFEFDTLLICLAPTLDLRYEKLYGFLQDHVARTRPSINLILNLLGQPGPERLSLLPYFNDDAPLFKFQLLKRVSENGHHEAPLLSQSLAVDKTIVAWLWGTYQPHPDLASATRFLLPRPTAFEHVLTAEMQNTLLNLTANPIVVFHGPDRGVQETAAKFIAFQANRPLLLVDLEEASTSEKFSSLQIVQRVLRDARLNKAIPCLFNWDIYLNNDKKPAPHLLEALCTYPDLIMVAGRRQWQSGGVERERTLFWQHFPLPNYAQRRILWQHYLESDISTELTGPATALPDITQLADQFYLTTDQIRDAVNTVKDTTSQGNTPLTTDILFAAARAHSSARLESLAKKLIPRYNWDDIILPQDQIQLLQEIVNTVRGRSKVLEAWQVGKKLASSRGVAILFSGSPGTGKTMGAEIIAKALGLDLYKIDLSTLISKYIGETEKNLERIFTEAESSNAILFFDEADSLFGKRSEVKDSHDRYANIEVSYLLQRMEAYDGVTILATNLRANLDEAFTRRLHFIVNFPFPDEEDRRRIWHTLFPDTVPCHPNVDLDLLAGRFKLAGGNIRNIIVSAAYLAGADGNQVTMEHLLHSTARELQKMGRIIRDADMKLG